jgi:hypothetical protein
MIHCRIDDEPLNKDAKFACGIGWPLPKGDKYFWCGEALADYKVDCPDCNPAGPKQFGTPISELSGRIGEPGYARFVQIARSWGYE